MVIQCKKGISKGISNPTQMIEYKWIPVEMLLVSICTRLLRSALGIRGICGPQRPHSNKNFEVLGIGDRGNGIPFLRIQAKYALH